MEEPILTTPETPGSRSLVPGSPAAINGSAAVSERLSKRASHTIQQLNRSPDTHARSLVSGRSRLVQDPLHRMEESVATAVGRLREWRRN